MATGIEIAQQVMNELNRGSFWWTPGGTPEAVRVMIGGDPYVANRHGSELRFYRPGESRRWLSVRVDVHTDGHVTLSPDVGATHFSSLHQGDALSPARLVAANHLVEQALDRLGHGRPPSPPGGERAQLEREVASVAGIGTARRRRRPA